MHNYWDEDRLRAILREDLAEHILEYIHPPVAQDILYTPYWMLETRGNFTVKSACEYLRRRRDPSIVYKNMCVKELPFKISFFMCKVWKAKFPLDDAIRRIGYPCLQGVCVV